MLPRLIQDTDKMTILNPFNVILTDQSIRHTTDSWYQMNNEANVYQHCKLKCDTGSQISQSYSGKNSVVSLRPVCWAAAGAVARTEEWSDKNWTQVHSTKTLVSGPGLPLPPPPHTRPSVPFIHWDGATAATSHNQTWILQKAGAWTGGLEIWIHFFWSSAEPSLT